MEIARRLQNACADRSKRSIASDAGIDTQTLISILRGDTWCDAPTIYRLEKALKVHLRPRRHTFLPPNGYNPHRQTTPSRFCCPGRHRLVGTPYRRNPQDRAECHPTASRHCLPMPPDRLAANRGPSGEASSRERDGRNGAQSPESVSHA